MLLGVGLPMPWIQHYPTIVTLVSHALMFTVAGTVQAARYPARKVASLRGGPEWGAFVLNLDREPTRFAGFMRAVKDQEPWLLANLERVPAVDGKTLLSNFTNLEPLIPQQITLTNLERARNNANGTRGWEELSPGAVGLYLSHAKAWQRIKDEGLQFGLVFEDDLRFFSKYFKPTIDMMLNFKIVADIVYLQHCEDSSHWPRGQGYTGYTPWGNPEPRTISMDEIVPCTAAYLLSHHAVDQLLKSAFPIESQLDRTLSTKISNATVGLQRLILEPAVAQVGPESFHSNVQTYSTCEMFKFKAATWVGMWISHLFPC